MLLNGIGDATEALRLTESLRKRLAEPVDVEGHTLYPNTRIGVALSEGISDDAEALLRDADNALHQARQSKAGAVEVFHASMHTKALHSLRLEADLRRAAGPDLTVYYQPIVSSATAACAAMKPWRAGRIQPKGCSARCISFRLPKRSISSTHCACGWCGSGVRPASLMAGAVPDGVALPVSINLSAKQFALASLADGSWPWRDSIGSRPRCCASKSPKACLPHPTAAPRIRCMRCAAPAWRC